VSGAFAIAIFFTGLLLVILVHELAHYGFARIYGFKVQEYFVGFGPRIWSVKRNGIEYGAKLLPLGGYVKIAGMNPYEPVAPEDVPRSYGAKPIWQRAVVIFAGPASHFVLAAFLFALWLLIFGNSDVPTLGEVQPRLNGSESPAAMAGLRPGDRIISIGDLENPTPGELALIATPAAKAGREITYRIERDGEVFDVSITPRLAEVGEGVEIGRIGILLGPPTPEPLVSALTGGVLEVRDAIVTSFQQIGRIFGPQGIGRVATLLFTDAPRTIEDPVSVVGIGQQVQATGQAGAWSTVLRFLAYATVFIGLLNLAPLPPFDGGHLAVLAVEKVRGRAVDLRTLIPISAAVMGFLIMFVTATVVLDIAKPVPLP
jgi:membrane-associated protease RseP (regulator of RpoE activity)